jgi:hypothetical protein
MKLSYLRSIIRRKLNENVNFILSEEELLNKIDSSYIDQDIENDEINPWGDNQSEDLSDDEDFKY